MIRLLIILLLCGMSLNAAIPPLFFRHTGTNAVVVDTNVVETDIFIVEAEDFNANSGVTVALGGYAFNTKSLYYQSNAVRFIDHDTTPTDNDNIYRALSVDVGTVTSSDPEFIELFPPVASWSTATANYDVYPYATVSNDWMNYTRIWTNSSYHVYARMGHALTNMGARLSKVTSDRTVSNQTTTVLGEFTNSASGAWNAFSQVELRTNGVRTAIALNGTETVRFTHATDSVGGQVVVNHIQFRRLEAVATTDAFVGQRTGSNAYANNRSGWAYRSTQ